MSSSDTYTLVRIAHVGDSIQSAARLLLSHHLDTDGPEAQDELAGEYTTYNLDGQGAGQLFNALAGLPGALAVKLTTEEEPGDPGYLYVHVSGTGTFHGRCERGGDVVVRGREAAHLLDAAEEDRADLLEKLTGLQVLEAFEAKWQV
jgi:hypothetical protein